MGVDEGNLQVINKVDMTQENCPVTNVILNLLVYGTMQYSSTEVIIVYDRIGNNVTFSFYTMPIGDFIRLLCYLQD